MLIGVDIGTGGTKAVVFDRNGLMLGQGFKEYGIISPHPAWAEQWPDVWLDGVVSTVRQALDSSGLPPSAILAVAVSGLYSGSGVPVDKDLQAIRPCMIWMDRRARRETRWVKDNVPLDVIFGVTGNYVDSYYGFTKMMWMRDNEPDLWKKTRQFVTAKDYVIQRFTGELATDYSSAGNIGGLFDLKARKWSARMCEILGIPMNLLPERVTRSHDVVGKLNREYAQLTGLLEGTPIVAGGIDAPVAQFSCGVVSEGEHVAMAGTSICWGTVSGGGNLSPGLVSFPYVVNDDSTIYTFGGGATSGAIIRWFRDQFGGPEKEFQARFGVDAYALLELEMKARKVGPGAGGLLTLPYFMGERSPIWDPDARGAILGLTLNHGREHVYRSFMEGVAMSLRHNMEEALKVGIRLDPVCHMVGGAANSDVWSQIFADVTGYHIRRLAQNVEAPFGDAFLAGLAVGVFQKGEEIKNWLAFRGDNLADAANHRLYDKYYGAYKRLYVQTRDIMAELAGF
ncbi:MAG: FGGY-family carbohydrate kinase [Planctomycetota bacterium]|jgi:xylulokinase|nr:FGGY-family carbohydrate kinase [Planctomycetota bacterium]